MCWSMPAGALVLLSTVAGASIPDTFHAVWDSLLQQYVWAGQLDVVGIAHDPRFEQYLASLAAASPEIAPREAQMAFWLNAYNACGVALLTRRPGLRYVGTEALDSLLRADTFCIAGQEFTLVTLRLQLRRFGEPLLHFGAGGITRAFPSLPRRAFTAASLRRQLIANAQAFLRSSRGCLLDAETNTLWLSPLLAWYRADFEHDGKSILHTVVQYVEPAVAAFIAARRRELQVRFLAFEGETIARYAPTPSRTVKPLQLPKSRTRRR